MPGKRIKSEMSTPVETSSPRDETLEIAPPPFSGQNAVNLLQALAEHSIVGVYVIQDGALRYANPELAETFGYPRQELIGAPVPGKLAHRDDRDKVSEFMRRRIEGEVRSVQYTFRVVRKDGEVIHCEALGHVVELDGRPAIVGTLLDITDREQSQEALIESEAMFRSLAEKSPNMIFINQRGKVVYANQTCEEVMSYSREELLDPDFDFMQLIAPGSQSEVKLNFQAHMRGQEVPPQEYQLLDKAGERLDVIIATRLIRYGGDIAILGIVTDVTERIKAERELSRLLVAESRHRRLAESLARVGLSMTAKLELRELLDLICLEAMNLFEVAAAFVWLKQGEELVGYAGHGRGRDAFMGRRLSLDDLDSLAPRIVRQATAQYVNRAAEADDISREMVELLDVASILGVPLVTGSQAIGALMILDTEDPDRFGAADLEEAKVLGSQLAVAVESAQLIEQDRIRLTQLAALHGVSLEVAASLDLPRVLDSVLEAVLKLVKANNAHIYPYDQSSQSFGPGKALHATGERTPAVDSPREDGLTAMVARSAKAVVINDAPTHELFVGSDVRKWNLQAIAGFPLKIGDRVVGVLTVAYLDPHRFHAEELKLLELLANQTAVAIENAHLYGDAQRRLTEQAELIEAGSVISSTLELEEILGRIAEQMGRAIDATSAYICSYEPGNGNSAVLAEHVGPRATEAERVSDLGVTYDLRTQFAGTEELLEKRRPFSTHVENTDLAPGELQHMREFGAQSTLIIPLEVAGEIIGYAELWETERHREFSKREVGLCQAIAQQAAIAIQNGRLYDRAQQQIVERQRAEKALESAVEQLEIALQRATELAATEEALRDSMGALGSTLNVDEVLDQILGSVGRVVSHDTADIMLLVEGDGGSRLVAGVRGLGYEERGLETWLEEFRIPLEQLPNMQRMVETGSPVAIPDVEKVEQWVPLEETSWIRSYAGAPIRLKGRTIGFLNLCSETAGFYSESLALRLQAFADQAAVAIDNARLFSSSQQEITERRHIEGTLRASEERLKIVFEHAPDAYHLSDLRGTFLDANRAAEDLYGYQRDELIGKSYLDLGLLPTQEIPKAAGLLTRSAVGKPTGPDEFTILRKDRTQVIVELRTYPVQIEGKTVVLGLARNVTEHKQVMAEIQLLKDFNEGIVQAMAEGILVTDQDGTVTFANPAICAMLGRQEQELVGEHWKLFTPEDQREIVEAADRRRAEGASDRYELELLRKDGERLPVLISGRPRFEDGKFAGTVAAYTDFREVKQAEQALRISEENYRGIFEGVQDAILVVDNESEIRDANLQARELLGFSSRELATMTISDLMPEEGSSIVSSSISGGDLPRGLFETSLTRADGKLVPVEASTRWHSIGDESVLLVVVRDITERRKTEEAEREFSRLKEEFILSASHSLRTPLHTLMGFLELLEAGKVGEQEQQEFIQRAGAAARDLSSLVKNLLDAAQLESGQLRLEREYVALEALIADQLESLREAAEAVEVSLNFAKPEESMVLHGSPLRLGQVFANLLDNAIKVSPRGGVVKVLAECLNGAASVEIHDQGPGYSQAALESMLEQGMGDKSAETGDLSITGLGLYLAKSLVEAHGGRLTAKSKLGEGTRFTITLPLS